MFSISSRLFLLALLPLCLVAGALRAEECDGLLTTEEVLAAEDNRYTAQTGNDLEALDALVGEDLVYIHSTAAADDKAGFLASLRSGAFRYFEVTRSEVKVRVYGCLAVVTGRAVLDVAARGQRTTLAVRFHAAYAKSGSRVRFVSWQSTRIPDA